MGATYVFQNGEILTIDTTQSIYEAVAIKENRIVAIGKNEDIEKWIGEETTVIDLGGKTLMPGFIDAHLHFINYGVFQLDIDCKPSITSIEDLLTALKERAAVTPKGKWIRASGFNETTLKEKRYPTIDELDSVSTEHPIVITRTCSHIGVVNHHALSLANITENTPNPAGGIIEKDENEQFTGRLIEMAYMNFNDIAVYTPEELTEAMQIAEKDFLAQGITSVHDAGTFDAQSFRMLQQASNNREIKIRIYAMIASLNDCKRFTENMLEAGVVTGTGDDHFKIGPAKLFTDGSSTGPTIATREGYTSNPDYNGILYYSEDEIYEVLGKAHSMGYQITVHAQGDKAIEMYLNVVERALREHPRENHRHRIEHAGISTIDLQRRMKDLGVIPIPNPAFPYEFGHIYQEHYGERTNYMYPSKDFLDTGILCAAGSDSPVTTFNPMIGVHTAVNRQIFDGTQFGPQQKIALLDILKMYTYNAAYASFEENIKGSIEVGKLADLIVLDETLTTVDPQRLKDVAVTMTMLDGEIVFEKVKQKV